MNPDTDNSSSATKPSSRAVPAWIIVLTLALGYFGVVYVDDRGAAFSRTVYGPWKSESDFAKLIPPKDPVFEMGKAIFENACAQCHQKSGLGVPGLNPPLVGSEWVLAEGANRIIRVVLDGATGPISVKGTEFNATMLAWRPNLDDKQIAAVLTFVRNNPDWDHKAGPVKPEEVAKIRKATAERTSNWTAKELEAVPVKE
jgi:mono/diheme cytochrome c family protein